MKKGICILFSFLILVSFAMAVATSEWYTITPSTSTPSGASISGTKRVRSLSIVQPATTPQTLTFYSGISIIQTVKVPATAGIYPVFTNLNDIDNITITDFAVKSSTSTETAQVLVLVR